MSAAEAFQVETPDLVILPTPLSADALIRRLEREVAHAFEPHDWQREWGMERERSYALTILRHCRTPLRALHMLGALQVNVAARGYRPSTGLGARLATIAVNFTAVCDESTRPDVRARIAAQDVW